jgi:hypothetical protein
MNHGAFFIFKFTFNLASKISMFQNQFLAGKEQKQLPARGETFTGFSINLN